MKIANLGKLEFFFFVCLAKFHLCKQTLETAEHIFSQCEAVSHRNFSMMIKTPQEVQSLSQNYSQHHYMLGSLLINQSKDISQCTKGHSDQRL